MNQRSASLIDSFNYAFEGIIHVLRTQRNMRIHFGIAVVVLVAAIFADVTKLELIALLLARLHRRTVVVPEQVQQPVRERRAPRLADDLWAQHDVAERARHAVGQLVAAVDREREHVGRLVDPEVLALQHADLVGPDEREPELAVLDPLGPQYAASQLDRGALVHRLPAPVVDLDGQHTG